MATIDEWFRPEAGCPQRVSFYGLSLSDEELVWAAIADAFSDHLEG